MSTTLTTPKKTNAFKVIDRTARLRGKEAGCGANCGTKQMGCGANCGTREVGCGANCGTREIGCGANCGTAQRAFFR